MIRQPDPGAGDLGPGDDTSGNNSTGGNPPAPPGAPRTALTLATQARPLPVLYGTAKVSPIVIEKQAVGYSAPPNYTISTTGYSLSLGTIVQNYGKAYRCSQSGVTVPAWQPSHAYVNGNMVANPATFPGANWYICTGGGTSAGSGGPSGTGTTITDGTALWSYVGPAGPSGTATGQTDGTCKWDYVQDMPMLVFTQNFVGALCEGQIQGAKTGGKFWWDKELRTVESATAPGAQLAITTGPDAANQSLPAAFEQSGYQHTALIYPSLTFLGVPSGTKGELPAIAIELQGVMFGASTSDVSPADIVNDLLTHTRRGCGWPSSRVDTSITGTGASGYRVYCDAMGLRMSLLLDTQRTALEVLSDLLLATNSDAVWSGGKLKIVPKGDQSITTPVYGATNYVPANTVQYALGVDDFLDKDQPVRISVRADVDCFNSFPVEYTERASLYGRVTVEDPAMEDVELRGLLRGQTVSLPVAFPDGTAPVKLSRIYAQRSLNVRSTYTFRLAWKYVLLEPGDIVSLTEPVLGLSALPVRITAFEEGEDGTITITAEDYPAAVSASVGFTPVAGDGAQTNQVATVANIPQTIDGVKTSAAPGAIPRAALTSVALSNLWPNGTSEKSPPAGIVVLNDGSSAEWDYRQNVGAAAYGGNWIRQLSAGTWLYSTIPASQGESYYLAAQVKKSGTNNARLEIAFLDVSGSVLFAGSISITTTSWSFNSTTQPAPAGTCFVRFGLGADASTTASFDAIFASLQTDPGAVKGPGSGTAVMLGGPAGGSWVVPGVRQILQGDGTGSAAQWVTNLAQESWTDVSSFTNSWVNTTFSPALNNAGYMKDSQGFVHLRGAVKSGTVNAAAFTLPVGYRPAKKVQFPVSSNDAFGLVQIFSDGTVVPAVGSNVYFCFDSIIFDTR